MNKVSPVLIGFAPEEWDAVRRFGAFYRVTYRFNKVATDALLGIEGRTEKLRVLRGLAERLAPQLVEDQAELDQHGYTPATRSKALAAVLETMVCELYSILDCTKTVLHAVYPTAQAMTKKSTDKLFSNAAEGKIGGSVPGAIVAALASAHADWFGQLRRLRVQLIHFNVGSCSRQSDGSITYVHSGLGSGGQALVIENMMNRIAEFHRQVSEFLDTVFGNLNKALSDERAKQVCGIFGGLIYERNVSVNEAIDFHGGVCFSHEWFDRPDRQRCPLADCCGAYARVTGSGH